MSGAVGPVAGMTPARKACAGVFAAAAALASLLLLPESAHSASPVPPEPAQRAHVYLMRGLMNIFSLGMDQLAAQIERHGIAASVYNHSAEASVVEDIAARYRAGDHGPIILVGHSLGADAVMMMAQQLDARDVPVALVVPFDGTASYMASKNVACVLNLTQRYYAYERPGPGFHGSLRNVNVASDTSIDHFTIDKSPRMQGIALSAVLQAAHAENCRPGANAPAVAKPNETPKSVPAKSASPALPSDFQG
jgi:pimeloyl-ACP methyl ester carboxylesterase